MASKMQFVSQLTVNSKLTVNLKSKHGARYCLSPTPHRPENGTCPSAFRKLATMKWLPLLLLTTLTLTTTAQSTDVLERLLRQSGQFDDILDQPEKYQTQILFTQIDRDAQNRPRFTTHTYGRTDRYFYPASAVKMPVAFLALETLNRLGIAGLDRNSPMHTAAGRAPQTPALVDTSSQSGLPSVGHYVRKVFLVSDNDAYNRLYEFVGQDALHRRLAEMGYANTRIVTRVGVGGFDYTANRYTNPVSFFGTAGELLYHQGERYGSAPVGVNATEQVRGRGYWDGEKTVSEAFDFSRKNYVPLRVLHDVLQAVMFPDAVPAPRRFDLSADDYTFLYRALSERPRDSTTPRYDRPDNYVKFFYHGDRDSIALPDQLKIFNKVGWAYGFLTDVSYIVDLERGTEFFVAATIHVNDNEIYNDGDYQYETVGLPFLAKLGALLLAHERQRPRTHVPDFTALRRQLGLAQ